jgi:hypothetical protein
MIELELPCCGGVARLADLADEIRCEDCGIAVDVAADPPPVVAGGSAVVAGNRTFELAA